MGDCTLAMDKIMKKVCTNCKETKQITEFFNHIKFGPRPECKTCSKNRSAQYWKNNKKKLNEANKKWRKSNKEKVAQNGRIYALKRLYGLTKEQYNKMLESQNNCCAICNKHESENIKDHRNGKPRELAVDHCHKTGKIRDLLCSTCNSLLGLINEDLSILDSIQVYLKKHSGELND